MPQPQSQNLNSKINNNYKQTRIHTLNLRFFIRRDDITNGNQKFTWINRTITVIIYTIRVEFITFNNTIINFRKNNSNINNNNNNTSTITATTTTPTTPTTTTGIYNF